MIVTREREKLLAAMVYFCHKTKHCHTLKLFKLLNLLDFEHYRQTGRSVRGVTRDDGFFGRMSRGAVDFAVAF